MYIHPDLDCRYQNRVLIIYTVCTAAITPVLVPLQLQKDKSSSVCTPKSHIYTMKALSDRSAMFLYVCNLHNGFVDEMHAELRELPA